LNSELGITLCVLVTSATILNNQENYTQKYINTVLVMV